MFLVCSHCVLATKFAYIFLNTQYQKKSNAWMILTCTCWKHQLCLCGLNNWGCFLLTCKINTKSNYLPIFSFIFVCISFCSVIKRSCCLSVDKINNCIAHYSFWTYYWKHILFFYFGLTVETLDFNTSDSDYGLVCNSHLCSKNFSNFFPLKSHLFVNAPNSPRQPLAKRFTPKCSIDFFLW